MEKFKVGDKAQKLKGYKFPCTIVSVFKTVEGKIRVVGEMDEYGLLHIFNEDQLDHYEEQNNTEKDREYLDFDNDKMFELWDGVYFEGSSVEIMNDTYTHIEKINTSDTSDGESHDYIVQRQSDGKFFKFNVWDAGGNNGYIFSDGDHSLTEVFQNTVNKHIYE
jgi:hypothetical protein